MSAIRHAGPRCLTDEPLRVASELIGQPLASPARRLLAIAVDWLLLLLPTTVVVLLAAAVSLRLQEPQAIAAMREVESLDAEVRQRAWRELARFFTKLDAPGLPASVKAAVEEGDLDRAAVILDGYDVWYDLHLGGRPDSLPPAGRIRFELEAVIPKFLRAVVQYLVAAVYFTLFTASRSGATPGKRLLRIRVVHLGGRRLHLWESLERFVGYLHIPGTLGLAFFDLYHDPNRRMGHDRAAQTVVLRRPARPAAVEPERQRRDSLAGDEQAAPAELAVATEEAQPATEDSPAES